MQGERTGICWCCGREYSKRCGQQRYCGPECQREADRRRTKRKYTNEKACVAVLAGRATARENNMHLIGLIAAEARKAGMSYGRFVAREEQKRREKQEGRRGRKY